MRRAAGLALALALAGPGVARADCPDADLVAAPETLDAVRAAVVCVIDERRGDAGLSALRASTALARGAAGHSADMVAYEYLAHEAEGRPSLYRRIRATGYFDGAADALYSENIGLAPATRATARVLVDAWMTSPGHRANVLHPVFRDLGVGLAFAGPDPVFYPDAASVVFTTDFGQRHKRSGPPGPRCHGKAPAHPRKRYCRR
jgi:uncharacterized protein YkwD